MQVDMLVPNHRGNAVDESDTFRITIISTFDGLLNGQTSYQQDFDRTCHTWASSSTLAVYIHFPCTPCIIFGLFRRLLLIWYLRETCWTQVVSHRSRGRRDWSDWHSRAVGHTYRDVISSAAYGRYHRGGYDLIGCELS